MGIREELAQLTALVEVKQHELNEAERELTQALNRIRDILMGLPASAVAAAVLKNGFFGEDANATPPAMTTVASPAPLGTPFRNPKSSDAQVWAYLAEHEPMRLSQIVKATGLLERTVKRVIYERDRRGKHFRKVQPGLFTIAGR